MMITKPEADEKKKSSAASRQRISQVSNSDSRTRIQYLKLLDLGFLLRIRANDTDAR